MKCTYEIKKPGGGTISIPSTFGLLQKNDEKAAQLYEAATVEDYGELLDYIHDTHNKITSRKELSEIIVDNLSLEKSKSALNNIIANSNKVAENNATLNTFELALMDYLSKNTDKVEDIQGMLEENVKLSYFSGISDGIINSTSIEREHNKIQDSIHNTGGVGNGILHRLNSFFNYIKDYDPTLYDTNKFLSNNSELSVTASTIGDYSMFQTDSYESLFLSVFKRVAETLQQRGSDIAKLGETYFTTNLTDEGIEYSGFEQALMSKDPAKKAVINKIISDVAQELGGGETLINIIKDIFIYLNPDIYLEESSQNTLRIDKFLDDEYKFEITLQNNYLSRHLSETKNNKDEYYAPTNIREGELIYFLENEIALDSDLIKISLSERFSSWVVPTKITRTKNNDIRVQFKYLSSKNNIVTDSKIFRNSDTLEYRKAEVARDPYTDGEVIDITQKKISVQKYKDGSNIDVHLIKEIIEKGDFVKFSEAGSNGKILKEKSEGNVYGIYPGYVLVQKDSSDSLKKVPYSLLIGWESSYLEKESKLEEDLDLSLYTPITDMSLVSRGDIIQIPNTKLYRTVLVEDVNSVYVYSPKKDGGGYIQKVNRDNIEKASSYVRASFTPEEYKELVNYGKHLKKKEATVSQFKDLSKVKNGDYIKGFDNRVKSDEDGNISEELIMGKVIDVKSGKVAITRGLDTKPEAVNINVFKDATAYTHRDLTSNYTASILRINSWRLYNLFENKGQVIAPEGVDPQTLTELIYIVPKETEVSKMYLLSNNYANVGRWVTKEYQFDSDKFTNITGKMLELLEANGRITKGQKIYNIKESPSVNLYKRDLLGLNRVPYFNTLPSDVKKSLDTLHRGVYFNLWESETNMGYDNYRIVNTTETTVTAQTARINDEGKIIIFEETFDKDRLLASKQVGEKFHPVGSIANLFLQRGNRNRQLIVDAIENKLDANTITKYKHLNVLVDRMTETFSPLGIEVVIDKGIETEEGKFIPTEFKLGEKAKIETSEINGEIKTRIVLNSVDGNYSDLIHENLHVYLTLMRYSDLDGYASLIDNIIANTDKINKPKETDSLGTKEEYVVNTLIDITKGENDFLYSDLSKFLLGMQLVIKKYMNNSFSVDADVANNPVKFLNKTARQIYNIKDENTNMFLDMNLISIEPQFRNWMDSKNIQLKCK